ncbi:MAG: NADH-quinone oxidoreductase subunit NuoE [Armatimonadota bacterium]
MLTEHEQQEIEELVRHNAHPKAALPEALKIVQRRKGWVSDEEVADLSAFFGMTAEEIDRIATGYNLIFRRSVGRHVILLCDSVSCWITGVNPLAAHLQERLGIGFGETTKDGRFTLLPAVCLGACDRAPVMMVDEDLHVQLTPQKIDDVLGGYA